MAKYKPIPKQKRASTSAAKKGPRVMSGADKVRMIRIVKLQPKSDVPQPPQNAQAKRGLSIARILDATTADALNFGHEIVIESAKKFRTGKGLPAVTSKSWHRDPLRPDAAKRIHESTIIARDEQDTPISKAKAVFISCDCEDWCYRWEYACATYGATRIMYGNGAPPVITNPQEVPGCCKHLVALLRYVRDKGI